MANQPTIEQQGKVIAEWDDIDSHWLVMFPDGTILSASTKRTTDRLARKWFRDHKTDGTIGVGEVEYRA